MAIISATCIDATRAFKSIDKAIQPLYLKRANREKINHALVVYKNTKYIDNSLGTHLTNIVKELIKIKENEK